MDEAIAFPRRMGPVDAMFWRMERERTLRSTTLAVAFLDGTPDRALLRGALSRVCRRIPRLRQRVIELPAALGTPLWSADPDFELDYHLRWIAAPGDGDRESLLDLAASMAMQSFDRARPLWEFVVVEGMAAGRTALIQKLHHSVGDGAAGVALMGELYDFEREAPRTVEEPEREAPPATEESVLALAAAALGAELSARPRAAMRALSEGISALRRPLASARRIAAELRAVAGIIRSGPGPLSPIMQGRSSRYRFAARVVPNAGLKAAARAQGCTFNAAFLAALAGGLGLYHERRGAPVRELRVAIPINVRAADAGFTAGNRLAIGRFTVPVDEPDAGRRMRAIQSRVAEQRQPDSLGAFEAVAALVNRAPPALLLPLVRDEMRKSDLVATAVPGPPTSFYLAERRVESLFTFGPTAGAAVNVTLFGYGDQASVGITIDPVAVPDRALLVDCFEEGLDQVLKLA